MATHHGSVRAFISSRKAFTGLGGNSTASSLKMLSPNQESQDPVSAVARILEAQERDMSPAAAKKARARLTEIAASCNTPTRRRRR